MNRDFVAFPRRPAHDRRRDERRPDQRHPDAPRPAAGAVLRAAAAGLLAAGLLAGCAGGDSLGVDLFGGPATAAKPAAKPAPADKTVPVAETPLAPIRGTPRKTAAADTAAHTVADTAAKPAARAEPKAALADRPAPRRMVPLQTAQAVAPTSTDSARKPAAVVDIPPPEHGNTDRNKPRPKSKTAARSPAYPACKAVRKPAMISFDRSVHPGRLVTVAAVGDVLLHDSVQAYAARHKDGFYGLMAPVADLIRAADVSFANLEGPAAEGVTKRGRAVRPPKRLYDHHVYTGYPMFNYNPAIVGALKRVGFDVLLTANNHALDRYALGVDRTIEAIDAAGLRHTGTRHRGEMNRPWYATTPVVKDGKTYTIAWLGCAYDTNGLPDRDHQVLHCYSQRETVLATVRKLAARPDIAAVILVPHWGIEYHPKPDARQQALAHDVLDAGATAVVGTHPHVIQPLEKYRTRDGRETLIAYSLGNFVSNQIGLARRSSAILLLGLAPQPNGKLAMASVAWIPIWMRNRGGVMAVEAIDRAGDHAQRNLRHLVRHLPEGNEVAARTAFWAGRACTRLAQR
jgi:poly-gamma-glutamate capsule biosynthesis protein CapA/YwtB (metallophosphatase superfamily)